jgi:hypothetical protein
MRDDYGIEEGAYDYVESIKSSFESDNSAFLRSIAISLKRVADYLDPPGGLGGILDIISVLEKAEK